MNEQTNIASIVDSQDIAISNPLEGLDLEQPKYDALDAIGALSYFIRDPDAVDSKGYNAHKEVIKEFVLPMFKTICYLLKEDLQSRRFAVPADAKAYHLFGRFAWDQGKIMGETEKFANYLKQEVADFLDGETAADLEAVRDFFDFAIQYDSSASFRVSR